jgi:hypothetical protein
VGEVVMLVTVALVPVAWWADPILAAPPDSSEINGRQFWLVQLH